ncbi:uncharacterized protein LOC130966769 [Arachis stenosperma]|uniref:uncharacterized protein LOC130966769 n=1 Tax=Arachis stenosperma TaxID=217475 RepID=UPI0025ACA3E3|nr:uncharacterized protein LOC130966769 [Arachis stenosperma]
MRRLLVQGFGGYRDIGAMTYSILTTLGQTTRGLVLAWDCGLRDIICETDCLDILPIMHELTSRYSSEVTDLVHKIQELLSRLWVVHVEWVSREANRAADWMARYGTKDNSNHVIWSEPCADFQQIIRLDIG